MASTKAAERLGPEDWVNAALRAIATGGISAVSVERLAVELGATKGSFYWHFKDRPALIAAALGRWEERETDQVIERLSTLEDPREQLRLLFRSGFSDRPGGLIDANLLADAANPVVADALQRVAHKRYAFVDALFQRMGSREGSDRALLAFSAFVGLVQLRRTAPDITPQGRRSQAYIRNMTEWLLGEEGGTKIP